MLSIYKMVALSVTAPFLDWVMAVGLVEFESTSPDAGQSLVSVELSRRFLIEELDDSDGPVLSPYPEHVKRLQELLAVAEQADCDYILACC